MLDSLLPEVCISITVCLRINFSFLRTKESPLNSIQFLSRSTPVHYKVLNTWMGDKLSTNPCNLSFVITWNGELLFVFALRDTLFDHLFSGEVSRANINSEYLLIGCDIWSRADGD